MTDVQLWPVPGLPCLDQVEHPLVFIDADVDNEGVWSERWGCPICDCWVLVMPGTILPPAADPAKQPRTRRRRRVSAGPRPHAGSPARARRRRGQ